MAECVFGIDLGLGGGIGKLSLSGGEPRVWRMPTLPAPRGKGRVYDLPDIKRRLDSWNPDHVFIEEAQLKGKLPKQVLQAVAGTARCQALFEMACCMRDYSCTIVPARTWQRKMFAGLGKVQDTKAASILVAKRLFPEVDLRPGQCRKDHHGLSDALLITAYGLRQLKGNDNDPT